MSDKPDDLAWWNGQPINAMTREDLQAALIEANLIIDNLRDQRDDADMEAKFNDRD